MENRFFEPIEKDLKSVDAKIHHFFRLKAGNVTDFAHVKLNSLDKHLRPALVILAARMFNLKSEKEIALASIVQLIYMASNVHLGISDEDVDTKVKNLDPRDGSQYPILIGDYLYGGFFQLLCDTNLLEMLKPLSETICTINEGSVLRKECETNNCQPNVEIISKEIAELIAASCRLGATLAGAKDKEIRSLHRFGLALGIAYGIINRGFSFKDAEVYLEQSLEELSGLPDSVNKKLLVSFVNKLSSSKMELNEVMVV